MGIGAGEPFTAIPSMRAHFGSVVFAFVGLGDFLFFGEC